MSQTLQESSPAQEPALPQSGSPRYVVGTLQYTKFALFQVCVWLLWGDFIWTLLDGCVPGILPLKLKDMGASDTANQVLNKSLACAIAFLFAPAVSVSSDRHRGRWGRRIPYLLWSTPFVGAFLVLIGCSEDLTNLATGRVEAVSFLGIWLEWKSVALIILGALFIGYDFANVFVGTIYWYLFNDVIPQQFISRYLALFRMVGIAGGALYDRYIFKRALDHFQFIFVTAGVCYVIGFMIMCFMVKEGDYPPPPENVDKRTGFVASAKTYLKECFTHRFYWYFFLTNTFMFMSWLSGSFSMLRNRDSLGLTLDEIGDMNFWTKVISFVIMFPCSWVADKWHPVRVYLILTILHFFQPLAQCIWVFKDYGHQGNLYWQYVISIGILPIGAVQAAAELPMYMRLLPKDRYGQFCSANAMIRSFAMMFGSVLAGMFMDFLAEYAGMGEWHYRYYAVWTVFWQIPAIIFLILLYKEWKARGGDKGYTPP